MNSRKTLPPTYFFIALVAMAGLHFLFPVKTVAPYPYNLFGLMPLALGAVLNLIADRDFKKNHTTVKPFEESTTLITNGVYRLCRHPMYLGMVMMLLGVALLMGSLSPFIAVIAFAAMMEVIFIRVEEQMLEQKFGHTWLDYKQRVRRWI